MLALAACFAVLRGGVLRRALGKRRSPARLLLVLYRAHLDRHGRKLAGLYDRDHRTLRHLTVDELPWLLVWR
jgi:hypothetical protein